MFQNVPTETLVISHKYEDFGKVLTNVMYKIKRSSTNSVN